MFTYQLSIKFLEELESIDFGSECSQLKKCKGQIYDFHGYKNPTSSSLSLQIFQTIYLDKQKQINGTFIKEIFEMEKLSMKPGGFYINKFEKEKALEGIDYRFYRVKNLESSIYMDYPIPITLKDQKDVNFKYNTFKHDL